MEKQGLQGAFYFRVYLAAKSKPDKPLAGTYNLADDTYDIAPVTWGIQVSYCR